MQPAFPLLSFQQKFNAPFYFVEEAADLDHCNLAGYYSLQQDPELFFDSQGAKYQRELLLKRNFGKWQKLLSFVYWGKIPVESRWRHIGQYSLNELKNRMDACIEVDDDVLTQFIEADRLQNLIKQARHFEDVYMILQGAIYNFEDDDSIEDGAASQDPKSPSS